MISDHEFKRLRWQCRRGMLELDLFLQKFLEQAFIHLSTADQELFVKLLACNDQDLFVWLTGKESPTDHELARMAKMVRKHGQTIF